MQLTQRRATGEDDYWRVRRLLRATWRPGAPWELNWSVVRWDYCRWHGWENIEHLRPQDCVYLWEGSDGTIAAVVHPEDRGAVFQQVLPAVRSPDLEEAMIAVAEQHLAAPIVEGRHRLQIWANEHDGLRQAALSRRGYRRTGEAEYQRRRELAEPVAPVAPPPGFAVRALRPDELPARSLLSWHVFHPDAPAADYKGWEWYPNVQRCPLYRRDLDLVAEAPDGTLAAFATVWFDDVNRHAVFEPVGTGPAFRRLGLGHAIMTEGLRRAAHLGALTAGVGSYSPRAHALYESVGFTDYARSECWEKVW